MLGIASWVLHAHRNEDAPRTADYRSLEQKFLALAAEFGVRFSFVFLVISSLSFLGIGIQPPAADLGSMVRENAALISFGRMTPLIPAFCIGLLTIGVNFIVDWLLHVTSGLKD